MTTLGRSSVDIGRMGLGCASIGNLFTAITDETALATVDAAWDSGIRYFDTAPHYGLGLSERRLGAALAGKARDGFVVSTKVGRILDQNPSFDGSQRDSEGFDVPAELVRRWDHSAAGVRASIESSLERLNLNRIDLVIIHDPEQNEAAPEQGIREAAPELERMRDEGMIGAFGVGTRSTSVLERFVAETSVDAIMLAGRYTLLNHEALTSLLPACQRASVSVIDVGVFNSGILAAPRPIAGAMFEYERADRDLLARVNAIADVCAQFKTTLPKAALSFALGHPTIAAAVIGASAPEQARANSRLLDEPLPPQEFWAELVRRGLLEDWALEGVRHSS
jgi:D-threo-aldose 1-dehydrogenase